MIEQNRLSQNPSINLLSQKDARTLVCKVNQCATEAKQILRRLHDEKGWSALGYNSWQEFCEAEINLSRANVYRLVAAEQVRDNLSQNETFPDSHAVMLSRVEPDRQAAIYETAKRTATGKLTAKHIKETAEDEGALPPKWGARGKGQSADWGRGKSGRCELEQKLKTFTGEQKYLFLLKCAEQLGHSARWEIASEVEKVRDIHANITQTAQKIDFTY